MLNSATGANRSILGSEAQRRNASIYGDAQSFNQSRLLGQGLYGFGQDIVGALANRNALDQLANVQPAELPLTGAAGGGHDGPPLQPPPPSLNTANSGYPNLPGWGGF